MKSLTQHINESINESKFDIEDLWQHLDEIHDYEMDREDMGESGMTSKGYAFDAETPDIANKVKAYLKSTKTKFTQTGTGHFEIIG